MIDFRIDTFLTLCETMNYTKAAAILHITQPAVTQHIKYLENYYQCRLFSYTDKTLVLTEKGVLLKQYALSMCANAKIIKETLRKPERDKTVLHIGATKTIGEYVLPDLLPDYLLSRTDITMHLLVDNTHTLLTRMEKGELDFAVIEGFFHKENYDYQLFSMESFIAVASPSLLSPKKVYVLEDLFHFPLLVREKGSGTRDILTQVLYEKNLSFDHFKTYNEISDFTIMKKLLKKGLGISFLYLPVVQKDLEEGSLIKIPIRHFQIQREFNFVYLKKNLFRSSFEDFFEYCIQNRSDQPVAF